MSIQVGIDRIEGIDELRERFGNSSQLRRDMGEILNQAARIGAESARLYAPKGATRQLVNAITDDTIQFRPNAEFIQASFGVTPVKAVNPGFIGRERGSAIYPVFVHEGTGLFGHFHEVIKPRVRKYMVFVGKTGLVKSKSVRGQRAQPYMREAYADARVYIEAHLGDMLGRLIKD